MSVFLLGHPAPCSQYLNNIYEVTELYMLKRVVMSVSEAAAWVTMREGVRRVNGLCFLEVGRWWRLDEPRVAGKQGIVSLSVGRSILKLKWPSYPYIKPHNITLDVKHAKTQNLSTFQHTLDRRAPQTLNHPFQDLVAVPFECRTGFVLDRNE